jgi:hypothetical protein
MLHLILGKKLKTTQRPRYSVSMYNLLRSVVLPRRVVRTPRESWAYQLVYLRLARTRRTCWPPKTTPSVVILMLNRLAFRTSCNCTEILPEFMMCFRIAKQ